MDGDDAVDGPPPGGSSRTLTAAAFDRLVAVLDRAVPAARVVRTAVTVLAAAAAGSVLVWALAMVVALGPLNLVGWLGLLGLVVLLAIAPMLLVGMRWLLTGVVELPDRLRREPGLRRDQLEDLAALAAGQDPVSPDAPRGCTLRVGSAVRVLLSARGELLAYTVFLRLASVPYLVVSGVAAAVALVEVLVLPLAALVLVVVG